MPESEPEKIEKTEAKAKSAAKPETGRKPRLPRGVKWTIVLLSILCVILLGALLELALLPRFLEQDINKILQKMAGDSVEFRIKTISLTSAEVACKVKDTTRNGRPLNVGSIGSLSIRYSPLDLLRDRAIESIDIENCNVTADYSDGSFSIPAYDIIAKSFLSGEKKEKDETESAPADDLNAVIPVKIGRVSLSGNLAAVARGEDSIDTLHIPYAVSVRPDAEQGWNKIDCSLMVHFATNGIRCKATYLHKEKKVELDLDDFSLATSALPGTVRSGLPRGLRAGVSMNAKAEIDLSSLNLEDFGHSSLDLKGNLTLGYRMPQGLRIDSAAPFSLKTVPRVIPTVKPMNPPKTEMDIVFTLGTLKGEYDKIPFELGDINASVSLRRKTLHGGFQLTVAESEPAKFLFDGSMDGDRKDFELMLESSPLLKASYRGIDASLRPGKLAAKVSVAGDAVTASADFACAEIQAGLDGASLDPELKGLTAFLRPESFSAHFRMDDGTAVASAELAGGELGAGFKGMNVAFKPATIRAEYGKHDDETNISAGVNGGELLGDVNGIKVSFQPETLSAGLGMSEDGSRELLAELKGGKFLAELEGMTCVADTLAFNAESQDGQMYKADAKISDFQFRQTAASLAYDAPELGLNAAFDIGGGVLSGEAVCPDSKLSMPELKLLAQNLRWDFPFVYTIAEAESGDADDDGSVPAAVPRTGKVSLGDFEFDGIQAASFDGTIQWDDAAKALHLKMDAHLFSIDGEIYANIVLDPAGVETECGIVIPDQDADLSKDLAKFLPQFEEISCTGKLGGSAVYKLLPKTTTGNAQFRISDADVLIPEQKLEVRGIDLGFEVPEIAVLKSAPGQTLTFKSVKYDKIKTGAGRATFRMETPDTWQIENAVLDWCNGHIRLGGITYRAGQTKTEAVLYCDRLDLPLFLTQIGLGQISGSGSINGTIPVVLVQKTDVLGKSKIDNVYFDDAFLFSTPGEDGEIKGDIDEALMDAESGIEMELAKDALKDFSYSWVRMRMLSTGSDKENLKLELQLDGRPNRALYYAFDENTASFVKSPTPCIFQGIRLDTNVNMYGKAMELVDYFQQIFSKGQ